MALHCGRWLRFHCFARGRFLDRFLGLALAPPHVGLQGSALLVRQCVQVEFEDHLVLVLPAFLHNAHYSLELLGGQVLDRQAQLLSLRVSHGLQVPVVRLHFRHLLAHLGEGRLFLQGLVARIHRDILLYIRRYLVEVLLDHINSWQEIHVLAHKLPEEGKYLPAVVEELEKRAVLALLESPIDQTEVHPAFIHLWVVHRVFVVRLENLDLPESEELLEDDLACLESLAGADSFPEVLRVHLGQRVLYVHIPVLQVLLGLGLLLHVAQVLDLGLLFLPLGLPFPGVVACFGREQVSLFCLFGRCLD